MKGLYFQDTVTLRQDLPIPAPQEGESLIRISLASICNTDKEVMRGYKKGFCGVLGHEFVGIVEQSDRAELVGKRVVGELNSGCGECIYCRTGREKHCTNRRVIGMQGRDGCFAEYMTLDSRLLHVVPEGLADEQAVLTEPLAAALEVLESSHIPPSTEVAVIGDGRLAFMITQVLALAGTPVQVFGKHEEKLTAFAPFARTSCTPQGSYEIVVEATGAASGLETAMKLVRSQGLLILKSTYADKALVNMSEFVVREITLRGSRCGPFVPALNLLARERITLPPIELHPLEDYEAAFSSRAFKAGFDLR